MGDERVSGRGDPPALPVDLVLEEPGDRGGTLEFGLQDGKADLVAGTSLDGGAVRFSTDLGVRRQADGSVRFTGPRAHGPSTGRFLYVSFRQPGAGTEWSRRVKVPLPSTVEEGTRRLHGRWRDKGTPRAEPVEGGWRHS